MKNVTAPAAAEVVEDFGIEDYVAPEKAAHKYSKHIDALTAAGEGKVSTGKFDTEVAALEFLHGMQTAANRVGKSASKRAYRVEDGVHYMSVGLREKISRNRPAAAPVAPVETPAA